MTTLPPLGAEAARRKLDAGEAILIDIRERDEHAREHIAEAQLAPLSSFDAKALGGDRGKTAIFHCKSGMRTRTNAERLSACGFADAYFLDGGIEAWKAAGYAVRRA